MVQRSAVHYGSSCPNFVLPSCFSCREGSAKKMQVSSHKLKVVPSASIDDVQAERVIQQPDEALDRSREPLTSVNSLACTNRYFLFGPFRLIPAQRLLLEGETEVRLGSRAFEILVTMVEQPGELVSKAKLMARVWPNTIVVEANLSVHVAALRRVLGDGERGNRYLITIPGQGYRFVAPVTILDPRSPAIDQGVQICGANLPSCWSGRRPTGAQSGIARASSSDDRRAGRSR